MTDPDVELPWMDEPIPLSEAIEIVARASMEDSRELAALRERVEDDGASVELDDERAESERDDAREAVDELRDEVKRLRTRVDSLESSADVECPNCGADGVMKAGVAAAVFAEEGRLSEANVAALDEAPLVCTECMTAFAPR
ncbi:MAG TPA: hypothetical protein VKM69_01355 [Natronoarchaeum rubrum]|nr:hypothetical protein [Natronoarchaeum rubrum]